MAAPAQTKTQERNRHDSGSFKETKKIDVWGYPNYTQPHDLAHIFSSFGSVKVEQLCKKFATLNFTKLNDAKTALKASKKIMIYGSVLTVKAHNTNNNREDNTRNKRAFPLSNQKKEVVVKPQQLPLRGNFLQQLDAVLAAVRLSQQEAVALGAIYGDVEAALQSQWPGCSAVPFGSITTGLGVKTSDADCFVRIPALLKTDNCVSKAKRVLQKYPHIFTEILAISNANTPIVKFYHVQTKTNCDISFKTPLGVQNSKLIAFLLYSDPRLIPMAVLIKYWARICGFSGSGKLTNYSLIMLIIFYLQQPPLSILPSVQWLQRDTSNDFIVNSWNAGFMDIIDHLPRSENNSTIAELLGGFFQYYSTFDFENNIVCPFLGYPVKRDDFKNYEDLPNDFERYKHNVKHGIAEELRYSKSMVIQDPFELSRNVASPVSKHFATDIDAFFKFAAKAYEIEKANDCETFLQKILLEKPVLLKQEKLPLFSVKIPRKQLKGVSDANCIKVTREVVFKIFEEILKLSLNETEVINKPESKNQKEKYITNITRPIWNRKRFLKSNIIKDLKYLEKQTRITEEILNKDTNVIDLKLELMLNFNMDSKRTVVNIKKIEGELNMYKEFVTYLRSVFLLWFKRQLFVLLNNNKENPLTNKGKTNQNATTATKDNDNDSSSSDDEQIDSSDDDPDDDSAVEKDE